METTKAGRALTACSSLSLTTCKSSSKKGSFWWEGKVGIKGVWVGVLEVGTTMTTSWLSWVGREQRRRENFVREGKKRERAIFDFALSFIPFLPLIFGPLTSFQGKIRHTKFILGTRAHRRQRYSTADFLWHASTLELTAASELAPNWSLWTLFKFPSTLHWSIWKRKKSWGSLRNHRKDWFLQRTAVAIFRDEQADHLSVEQWAYSLGFVTCHE